MKKYQIKRVNMDEYVGIEAKVVIDGMTYHIAEQVHETENGIERGGSDCYFFINGEETPNLSDALPVESEEEGEELYNSIIESMIGLYEG